VRERVKNETQMVPLKNTFLLSVQKEVVKLIVQFENKINFFLNLNNRCHSNLSLTEIMELVWHWTHLVPVHQVVQFTDQSKNTVVDWYNLCRDVAIYKFDKRSKLGGKDVIVQID